MSLVEADPPDWQGFVEARYGDDAVLVLPDGRSLIGHDAIRGFYEDREASPRRRLHRTRVSGDVAVLTTSWPADAREAARGTEVLRRSADGRWRVAVEVLAGDLPAARSLTVTASRRPGSTQARCGVPRAE